MQKAGCINNIEVRIESIDHQNVHIIMLHNIVIFQVTFTRLLNEFSFVMEMLYLLMCIPNCLNELKSALLINTSIMRQEL